MRLANEIKRIEDRSNWNTFFLAHPELCDTEPTDSDGKYLVHTNGFATARDLGQILNDNERAEMRLAAQRVASSDIEMERKLEQAEQLEAEWYARVDIRMRAELETNNALALSRSGVNVIFATDEIGCGRRNLSGRKCMAERQLMNAGIFMDELVAE